MSDELRKAAQYALNRFMEYDCKSKVIPPGALRDAMDDIYAALTANEFSPDWDGNKVLVERIRELEQEQDVLRHRLLEIMLRNGLATGHGDTIKQVIDTLEVELTDRRDAVCEWTCKACRETGLLHCSDPEHCGGMIYTESEASRNSRRYKWLVDYSLASTNTHDEAIINATTLEEFNAAIDAAMQQEQSNGTL